MVYNYMVRMLCIVNHKIIYESEIKIFEKLGIETFTPNIIPSTDPELRSIELRQNFSSLAEGDLEILNSFNFWTDFWTEDIIRILNDYFDFVYVALNSYCVPLNQSLLHFNKLIIGRAFGRESPYSYNDFFEMDPDLHLKTLIKSNSNFMFMPIYKSIEKIEPRYIKKKSYSIGLSIPNDWYLYKDTWKNLETDQVIFLCPSINESEYYSELYQKFLKYFGSLNYLIFGKNKNTGDPRIATYMLRSELFALYQNSKVFIYLSSEERHLHYTPIECMLIGIPVVYLKGSLLDSIVSQYSADFDFGKCSDVCEMQQKVDLILSGDSIIDKIRCAQAQIAKNYAEDLLVKNWIDFFYSQKIFLDNVV